MIFYRSYQFAPKATLVSAFANIGGYIAAIFAIVLLTQIVSNPIMVLPALLLGALAAFLIIYVGRKLPDKMAETETDVNIRTKPRFAQAYCSYHPDEYDRIAELNPEFGAKYMKNENNKIVKRK